MSSKITELISKIGVLSYSFEVTPDILTEELDNLKMEPLFFSITWHAHLYESKDLNIAPLKLASYLRSRAMNVLLHIPCTNMKRDYMDSLLIMLKNVGICNLFIILGEKFDPSNSEFKHTKELILYIRQRTGNYFCIGVAGYPDQEERILQLKDKITCGVDFILTQAFYEFNSFHVFIKKCKEAGITVPIIPGIFPFETEKEFDCFVNMCKIHVTDDLRKTVQSLPGNKLLENLITEIVKNLKINHLHFFTLNKLQRTLDLISTTCTINYLE